MVCPDCKASRNYLKNSQAITAKMISTIIEIKPTDAFFVAQLLVLLVIQALQME